MKHLALIALLLVLSSAAYANPTTTYTLVGGYIFQLNGTQNSAWSATSQCTDQNGNLHMATGGGSIIYTVTTYGTATFYGNGRATVSETQASNFDQDLSNATVQITWSSDGNCIPTIYNGYAVFDPPTKQELSGSYSISAQNGTGTLRFSDGGADFQSTGVYATCTIGAATYVVPGTIMIEAYSTTTPHLVVDAGIGQHNNAPVSACPPSGQ